MRGHEEASGTKYYPEGLQDQWKEKDPVTSYTNFLKNEKILSDDLEKEINDQLKKEITESSLLHVPPLKETVPET